MLRTFIPLWATAAAWSVVLAIAGAAHAADGSPATQPAGLAFSADRTAATVGRTRIVAFRLPQAPAQDASYRATSDAPGVLEVVRQPMVLQGSAVGFLRVRGLKPGKATLAIGDARLAVEVVAESAGAAGTDMERATPRIVTPAPGAAVWGKFAIGVDVWEEPAQGTFPALENAPAVPGPVQLRLPGGKLLAPRGGIGVNTAPLRRLVFEVDAGERPPGPVELVAVGKDAGGVSIEGSPVRLLNVRVAEADLIAGECEDTLAGPRPAKLGTKLPPVGSDPAASKGKYVVNAGNEPVWCFPAEVKQAGLYQLIATVRGDYGGGALPSAGIALGEADRAVSASRLADTRWHRLPIGRPVALAAGAQAIALRFLNDFYAPDYSDRNLFLDRYELARVDAQGPGAPAAAKADAAAAGGMAGDMAMTGGMMAMAPGGASTGADDAAVRIGLLRPLHGYLLRGDLTLVGYCWWADAKTAAPPRVTLLINGKPLMMQRAADPFFRLNPAHFRAGLNTVQLTATLDSGATAATPVQRVRVEEGATEGAPRAFHRFAVAEPAWGDAIKPLLTNHQRPDGHRVAGLAANGEVALQLPEDLAGPFDVFLDSRGEQFEGPPIAKLTLRTAAGETPIGEIKATWGWWNDARAGKVELPAGPKQIVVAFTNDAYKEKVGDRNLYFKAVSLRQPAPTADGGGGDRTPPKVVMSYPREGQRMYMADAVVAEACDNDQIEWADLVIDGKRQGLPADVDPATHGPMVFPLVLRSLEPGTHRVKVRVQDRAGNLSESAEVSVNVLAAAPSPPEATAFDRAARLLNRFAFGPERDELAAVLTMGERAWLEDRLSRTFDDPGEQTAMGRAAAVFPRAEYPGEVGPRVIHALQMTNNPARTRFVLWAQNHFSTWARKVEGRKWPEHERFQRAGVAPFGELLRASATSPAMLFYLDQQRSVAGRLNENYAREIMELHTMGVHAGYTQADVTALAALLTGWTCSEEAGVDGRAFPLGGEFRYDATLNDGGERRVFGVLFESAKPAARYDRARLALEVLAAHPASAEHVSRKLAEHYVASPAPQPLVDDLAKVFVQTGGDTKAVLLAIAEHPAFWSSENAGRVARPIDYAARLLRTTGGEETWPVHAFLDASAMGMFDCQMPNGYPEMDDRWADSNAVLQRWKLARQMRWRLSTLLPWPWRTPPAGDPDGWGQRGVDLLAVRLTGRVLGSASNEAALKVLAETPGEPNERAMQIASFVASLPESSVR